jgi:hypothetical protein
VDRSGDGMTGPLTMLGNSTVTVKGDAFSVGGATFAVASGRIGIGTQAPVTRLHVAGGDLQVGEQTASTIAAAGYVTLANLSAAPAAAPGRLYYDIAGEGALMLRLNSGGFVAIATGSAGAGLSSVNADGAQFTGLGTGVSPLTLQSSSVTLQGNVFNAADRLVKLDGSNRLPAVNASLLTNLPAASAAVAPQYVDLSTVTTALSLKLTSGAVPTDFVDLSTVTDALALKLDAGAAIPPGSVNLSTVTTALSLKLTSGAVPTDFVDLSTVTDALALKLDAGAAIPPGSVNLSTVTTALNLKLTSGAVPSGFIDLSTVTTALDGRVARAGDGMTGPLTMLGNSTVTVKGDAFSVGGSTLVVANGWVGFGTADPTGILHLKQGNVNVVVSSASAGSGPNIAQVPVMTFFGYTGGGPSSWDGSTRFTYNDAGFSISHNGGTSGPNLGPLGFGLGAGGREDDLFVSSIGAVGIGTSDPQYRLHVATGALEAGDIVVVSTGTSNVFRVTGQGEVYANKLYGDGSSLTGINLSSKVDRAGDGMTGPLTMQDGSSVTVKASLLVDGFNNAARQLRFRDADAAAAGGVGAFVYNTGSDFDGLAIHAQSGISLRTNATERVVVNVLGDVGIGVPSPLAKLNVNRPIPLGVGVSSASLYLRGSDNGYGLAMGNLTGGYAWLQGMINDAPSLPILLNPAGGSVGIGTMNPVYRLSVNTPTGAGETRNLLQLVAEQTGRNPRLNVVSQNTETGTKYISAQTDADDGVFPHMVLQPSGGSVAIGTTTPNARLHVKDSVSNLRFGHNLSAGSGGPSLMLETDSNVYGDILWRTYAADQVRLRGSSYGLAVGGDNPRLNIGYADANYTNAALVVNGNVGIGMTDPGSYKVNVAGSLNATEIRVNGTILTPGTGSNWTVSGADVYRAAGNVGIGASSPGSLLHLRSTNGGTLFMEYPGNTNSFIGQNSLGQLLLGRGVWQQSNSQLTIEPNGSVGIGVVYPAARLHVSSASALATETVFQVSSGTGQGQELLVVKGDGKVGVGKSDPGTTLDVAGVIRTSGSRVESLGVTDYHNHGLRMSTGSTNLWQLAPANGFFSLSMWNGSTWKDWVNVDATGRVGIGSTSPGAQLQSVYTLPGVLPDGVAYFDNRGANVDSTLKLGDSTVNSTRFILRALNDSDGDAGGATDVFVVKADGKVGIGTGTPAAVLDIQSPLADSQGKLLRFTSAGTEWLKLTRLDATSTAMLQSAQNISLQPTGGNVGVGTADPGSKLHVSGDVQVGDLTASTIAAAGYYTFAGISQPAAAPGRVYYDSAAKKLRLSTGTLTADWLDLSGGGVPAGAVMFFNLASCPSGWNEVSGAQGRYVVGLPPSGTLAGTAGSALSNLENRAVGQHDHAITDPGHVHDLLGDASGADVTVGADNGAATHNGSYAGNVASHVTGVTVNNAGSVAGTNAPYIQYLVCQCTGPGACQSSASGQSVDTTANLGGGTAGALPYQSSADHTTFLSIGGANAVLTSNGSVPTWNAAPALSGTNFTGIVDGALSSNVAKLTGAQTFSGDKTFTGALTVPAPMLFTAAAGDPAGSAGALYYNSTNNRLRLHIGSGFVDIATGTLGAGLDDKVAKAGDGMTGPLTMLGNSTVTVKGDAFSVGGSTLAVRNGRLGIGTADPLALLTLSAAGPRLLMTDASGGADAKNFDLFSGGAGLYLRTVDDAGTALHNVMKFQKGAAGVHDYTALFSRNVERARLDPSGQFGVGTQTPAARLHVSSESAVAADTVLLVSSGAAAGQELVAVMGDGRTGIGTTAPDGFLHVRGGNTNIVVSSMTAGAGQAAAQVPVLTFTGANGIGQPSWDGNTRFTYNASGFAISHNGGGAGQASGPRGLGLGTAGREGDLFISSGGAVGVGTTLPYYLLHVSSGAGEPGDLLAVSTGTSDVFRVNGQGEVRANKYYGDGSALTGVSDGADKVAKAGDGMTGPLTMLGNSTITVLGDAFSVGGSTLVVSNGWVGIGTPSPAAALDVKGSGAGHVMIGAWTSDTAFGGVSMNGSLGNDGNGLFNRGGYALVVNRQTGQDIGFKENFGANQMAVENSGRVAVGLGVQRAAARLHVSSANAVATDTVFQVSSGPAWGQELFQVKGDGKVIVGPGDATTTLTVRSPDTMGRIDISGPGNAWNYSGLSLLSNDATPKYWGWYHRKVGGETNNLLLEEFDGTNYKQRMVMSPDGTVDFSNSTGKTQFELQGLGDAFNYTNMVFWNNDWTRYWAMMHRKDGGDVNKLFFEEYNGSAYNTRMTLAPGGSAGIGTTAPAARLHVSSGTGEAGDILIVSTGSSNVFRVTGQGEVYANKLYGDGSALTGISGGSGKVDRAGDGMTGPLTMLGNSTITVRGDAFSVGGSTLVVANGWVGIGTPSPAAALDVKGSGAGHVMVGAWTSDTAFGGVSMNGSLGNDGNGLFNRGGYTLVVNRQTGQDIGFKENFGANQMAVENSGRVAVGLGVQRAAARLHVSSANAVATDAVLQVSSGTAAGQELLVVKGDGKVGIGTPNPGGRLSVQGTGTSNVLFVSSDSAGTSGSFVVDNNGNTALQGALKINTDGLNASTRFLRLSSYGQDGIIRINPGTDSTIYLNRESGVARDLHVWNGQSNDLLSIIGGSGNVGIGTTNPTSKLHVSSSTAGEARLILQDTSGAGTRGGSITGSWSMNGMFLDTLVGDNATHLYYGSSNGNVDQHHFYADGAERVTISSQGYVGIGTTTPLGVLHVASGQIVGKTTSNTGTSINFLSGNLQYTNQSCSAGWNLYHMKDGASYSLAVQGTGVGTCGFNAYSDSGSTALTMHLPPDHGATTTGKHTVYTFIVLGTHVYAAWIPGY